MICNGLLKEVFVDASRDESLIFELLDLKPEIGDNGSAAWFLQDLASEQEAEGGVVIKLWLYLFVYLSLCSCFAFNYYENFIDDHL